MDEKIFRKAKVKYKDEVAGYLSETLDGYEFAYDKSYLKGGLPISISLPLKAEIYKSKELFSFFEGLLPEGWYLNIVSATAKVDSHDVLGLLLATTSDTIGAVTVHKTAEES